MKDSGNKSAPKNKFLGEKNCEWIGEIPDEWNVNKIDSLYSLRSTKVNDVDYPPLSVTMKGIVPQLATAAKTDDHDNRKLVKKGDFAINSRSDRRGSCGISDYDGSVSLINIVLTPRGQMNPRYYNWLFHTEQFADEFYKWGHGIVNDLWTTRWQDMKHIFIVSPPLDEQKKIADYLDDRCSKIDELITGTTASIEDYKKLKQAIITEAVTKGLNKDVLMKDTGIDWIGEIPNDWKVNKIDSLYSLRSTKVNDVDYPPLSVTMKGIVPQLATAAKTDDHDNRKLVKKGDFAINSRSDRRGSCGISDYDGSVSLINIVLTPRGQMNPRYYNWFFHTEQFADEFYKWGHGIVDDLWTTRWQDMKHIFIVSPPLSEQKEIVNYLDKKIGNIDDIINEKTGLIEDLKAYKKSLIYEVVTGKKRIK